MEETKKYIGYLSVNGMEMFVDDKDEFAEEIFPYCDDTIPNVAFEISADDITKEEAKKIMDMLEADKQVEAMKYLDANYKDKLKINKFGSRNGNWDVVVAQKQFIGFKD